MLLLRHGWKLQSDLHHKQEVTHVCLPRAADIEAPAAHAAILVALQDLSSQEQLGACRLQPWQGFLGDPLVLHEPGQVCLHSAPRPFCDC